MRTALEVNHVSVTYRSVKNASIKAIIKRNKDTQDIHALNDVTFDVKEGEVIGIVGQNGSGKSTLLKTIGGIFNPDSGTIDLNGNTCALLAIGIGFIPNLTGRENIRLSGLLLGFTKEEIMKKEEEIIEYAEIGKFIDYPVRTYSSGMYSKLAFSITVMLKTDILLIDEILSVGDEHFKKKSAETIQGLIREESRTVILVSHILDQLKETCSRVIWIDQGQIISSGDPETIIEAYKESQNKT